MKSFDDMLDFTLSPNIKLEVQKSDPQLFDHSPVKTCIPTTSFSVSSPHFNTSNPFCFAGENDGFRPLCVMPVNSDGSLCLMDSMEAMEHNSSPKLENFLGSGTIVDQQYGAEDREQFLSLENMLCSQNVGEEETSRQPSVEFLQEPTREGEIQVHQHPCFSGMHYYNTCPASFDVEVNEITYLRNWILEYHSLNQQINCPVVDNSSVSGSSDVMGSEKLQSLSLSMSPGSQSSCFTASQKTTPYDPEYLAIETKKNTGGKVAKKQTVHRKSINTFGQRTSHYRGVTRHRWTGRYEAHLWDNSCKKEGQTRKGRQVYLGGYDKEEKAAKSYDLAALKYWGPSTHINFPLENYQLELEEMKNMSRQEYVAHLRRRSSGFSRGASIYRGVTRHHQHGRWQARIGRVAGNKDLYLGTFSTQEEAAEAYDIAAIKFRGAIAVTNFDISCYNVERIIASNTLPKGERARRASAREPSTELENHHATAVQKINDSVHMDNAATPNLSDWKMSLNQQQIIGDSGVFAASESARLSHSTTGDESGKVGACFSHSSSLHTSLNSSREASPDEHGESMRFAEPS